MTPPRVGTLSEETPSSGDTLETLRAAQEPDLILAAVEAVEAVTVDPSVLDESAAATSLESVAAVATMYDDVGADDDAGDSQGGTTGGRGSLP